MAILQMLFGDIFSCRPKDVATCCAGHNDSEILTKAWIDSLDQASVLERTVGASVQPAEDNGAVRDASGNSSPSGQEATAAAAGSPDSQGSRAVTDELEKLRVPLEFDDARVSMLRTTANDPPVSCDVAEKQRRCLQSSVRAFIKSLLHGISVSVLLDDGRTRKAEARLDSELTHLVLHVPNAQHPVPLKCIESVCTPDDVSPTQAPTQTFLDERCCQLIISGGQFLTFVFDVPRTREYFEMCLKVLILAAESSDSDDQASNGVGVGTGELGSKLGLVSVGASLGSVPEQSSDVGSEELAQETECVQHIDAPQSQDAVISRA